MSRKILVVDDTRNVQFMLQEYLQNQGFETCLASDGVEAMEIFHAGGIDLILLDIMMPNMDGYQFISKLRTESSLPVIMITAKQQEADVVRGFELGADDYITKPFRLRELLMRIRAVMRRAALGEEVSEVMKVQNLTLDRARHEVRKDGELIDLTPLEFTLLTLLMEAAGKVIRRQEISLRLMDNGYAGSEATIKIHIRNLRQKLGDDLAEPVYIETVFGIGYRFLEGES
ncbi:MAG TPA: response regulator transcription factor [Anaerolineaceae bacterium]|jgi:DNA-binding response OmpR family regulator|nr:response regulator transcription factor [Anaerolineaceae bacterium]